MGVNVCMVYEWLIGGVILICLREFVVREFLFGRVNGMWWEVWFFCIFYGVCWKDDGEYVVISVVFVFFNDEEIECFFRRCVGRYLEYCWSVWMYNVWWCFECCVCGKNS